LWALLTHEKDSHKKGSENGNFCWGINFFPAIKGKSVPVLLFFFLVWLAFYKIIKCTIIYGARQQKRQKFFKRKKRLLFNASPQKSRGKKKKYRKKEACHVAFEAAYK